MVGIADRLAELDPAADPDVLATTARQQLARQQQADCADHSYEKAPTLRRRNRRSRIVVLVGLAAVVVLTLLVLTLTLWTHDTGQPATERLVRTLTGHAAAVNAVAVTPDGRQAVSGSVDDTVRVWKLPAA